MVSVTGIWGESWHCLFFKKKKLFFLNTATYRLTIRTTFWVTKRVSLWMKWTCNIIIDHRDFLLQPQVMFLWRRRCRLQCRPAHLMNKSKVGLFADLLYLSAVWKEPKTVVLFNECTVKGKNYAYNCCLFLRWPSSSRWCPDAFCVASGEERRHHSNGSQQSTVCKCF